MGVRLATSAARKPDAIVEFYMNKWVDTRKEEAQRKQHLAD
jgi:hypothetical protein